MKKDDEDPTIEDLAVVMERYRFSKSELDGAKDLLDVALKLVKQREQEYVNKEQTCNEAKSKVLGIVRRMQ